MEWNKEEGIIFPFAFEKKMQVRDAMYYPSEKKRSSPRYYVLSFRKKLLSQRWDGIRKKE